MLSSNGTWLSQARRKSPVRLNGVRLKKKKKVSTFLEPQRFLILTEVLSANIVNCGKEIQSVK